MSTEYRPRDRSRSRERDNETTTTTGAAAPMWTPGMMPSVGGGVQQQVTSAPPPFAGAGMMPRLPVFATAGVSSRAIVLPFFNKS